MKRLLYLMCIVLLMTGCAYTKETTKEVLAESGSSWDGNLLPA